MSMRARFLAAGLAGLAAAVLSLAAPGGKLAAPEPLLQAIIKAAVAGVEQALSANPQAKKTPALVRTNALVIALAAENAGADGRFKAARDIALRLADAAKDKKLNPEAARRAADLLGPFPNLQAPAVGTPPRPLKEEFELDEVMNVFARPSRGGHDIEQELQALGEQKEAYRPEQLSAKLAADAYKSAWVARLSREYEEPAKGKVKQWQDLCDQMQEASLELAAAAQARQPGPAKAAVGRLNDSCKRCHDQFR